MTHQRDIDRLLDHWLSEGSTQSPDRVVDAVAERIERVPQQPAWRLRWKERPVNSYLKPLAAIAAVVLVAVIGFGLLSANNKGVGGPSASPTSSPASSPAATAAASAFACDGETTGCAGPIAAGDHASANFIVPLTYRTPDGWVNVRDMNRTYALSTNSGLASPIEVLAMNAIADQTASCDPIKKSGVGSTVQDFVDYLRGHPGLVSSAPVPAEVDGFKGQTIDFNVASTWDKLCPSDSDPFVLLLTDTGQPPGRALGYHADERVRWTILDVRGTTVIIEATAPIVGGTDFATAVAAAQPVIDSIKFSPGS